MIVIEINPGETCPFRRARQPPQQIVRIGLPKGVEALDLLQVDHLRVIVDRLDKGGQILLLLAAIGPIALQMEPGGFIGGSALRPGEQRCTDYE